MYVNTFYLFNSLKKILSSGSFQNNTVSLKTVRSLSLLMLYLGFVRKVFIRINNRRRVCYKTLTLKTKKKQFSVIENFIILVPKNVVNNLVIFFCKEMFVIYSYLRNMLYYE